MFYVNSKEKPVYAKVWSIERKEKYTDIRFSTSEKDNREEGKYINSSWFGRCIGHAHNQIADVNEKDTIKIGMCKITAENYKDKDGNLKTAPTRVTIFELITDNSSNSTNSKSSTKPKEEVIEDVDDGDLPF